MAIFVWFLVRIVTHYGKIHNEKSQRHSRGYEIENSALYIILLCSYNAHVTLHVCMYIRVPSSGRAFTCKKDSTGIGLPPSDVTFLAFCGTSIHVHVCEWIACCFSFFGGGVVLKALCGFSFIQDKN